MINAPVNESTFEPLEAGTYAARLYQIIHIGNIETEWQGETKIVNKIRFTFELPTELKVFKEENGEQPFVLSQEFTLSLGEKANLRKFIDNWTGKKMTDDDAKGLDIESLIGKEGLINAVQTEKNGKTYTNIGGISPLPKGMKCPPAINQPLILNYTDKWNEDVFDNLPDFLKEKIASSKEWQLKHNSDDVDMDTEVGMDEINKALGA